MPIIDEPEPRYVKTKAGFIIAKNYIRIVHGGRGDYVEIHPNDICKNMLIMPRKEIWRIDNHKAYYKEYHTKDISNLKIYLQKKPVSYADYKKGMYYVAYQDGVIPSEGILKHLDRFFGLKF
ncbi:MAG: hypothetical protein ACFFG0_42165 [Candidatus Thorarchaeota archaeon]